MIRYLINRRNTRGPVLGILVVTIFVAIALSLLTRWNQVGQDAEAGNGAGPVVTDPLTERDIFTVVIEGQPIQINASIVERMRIVAPPPNNPVAKQEEQDQISTTPVPAPQEAEPEAVQAPDDQSFGEDAAADVPPPTATPVPPAPTATAVPQQQPVATDNTNLIAFVSHSVQQGQTLYRLTVLYNTNYDMLARYGITEASMVPGAVLNVPYANGAACPSGRACPIARGDTVFRLALNHGVSVEGLRAANGIGADNAISAGGAVCIP
ncbi:MAG: LysM peptidoglycan-binding domain-containing protein [Chloroflexota bacterium]